MSPQPKALLFDIGGVCVKSPMHAILIHETTHNIPPGYINFAISRSAPNGTWHQAERGEIALNPQFFEGFKGDLENARVWREFCSRSRRKDGMEEGEEAPTPIIDAEKLFWEMMSVSREPDPHVFPALKRLKNSNRFIIAALSNTIIFPPGHPYNAAPSDPSTDVKGVFDVFVSSAHVGLRKPDPKIYELALEMVREEWMRKHGSRRGELEAGDVVFLDDIGENCKQGRKAGFRTIKVGLGGGRRAVKELEGITGMRLLEEGAKL